MMTGKSLVFIDPTLLASVMMTGKSLVLNDRTLLASVMKTGKRMVLMHLIYVNNDDRWGWCQFNVLCRRC